MRTSADGTPPAVSRGAADARAPEVAVVLLNYRNWSDTARCLASLRRLDYPAYRVVVVDNHSGDDSVRRLRADFGVEILEQESNRGFAAGANVGIAKALDDGVEHIWLLNNDTEVTPGSLGEMVATASADPHVGAVGCVILDLCRRGRLAVWGGGHVSFVVGVNWPRRRAARPRQLTYLTAASVLLRTAALRQTGLLDEGFFMYWEDVDLCVRLRRAGWKLAVAERAIVYHKEAGAFRGDFRRRDALIAASAVRFFRKHARVPIVPIVLGTGLRSLKRAVAFQPARALGIWASTLGALRHKPAGPGSPEDGVPT